MNILQVQDALKNASDMQLSGELQNPTGLAPSYLVLSEMKRRQQMRQGAMASPAPQSSMAEEAASQAQPEYYPEEQPQEEEAGIEAFREGGVVRMAEGGISGLRPIEDLSRNDVLTYLEAMRFGPGPGGVRSPYSREDLNARLQSLTAASRVDRAAANRPFLGSEENLPGSLASPPPSIPPPASPAAQPSNQPPATTEGQMPPTTVTAQAPAQPSSGGAAPRGGGGMPSGAAQPSGQATDPTIQALYDRLRATGQSREDYRKDAVNTGLMQAGLAMMASKDPNALANLGQGGLRGLESYTQEMRQGRLGERQGIQDEITIRRAQTEEAYRRGIITNQERQLRMAELRLGEAAGDRAERRADRQTQLEEANRLRSEAQMGRLIPAMEGRITRLNEQIGAFSMARNTPEGQTPRTRDPSMQGAYDALVRERAQLQNRVRNAQDFLIERGGVDLSTLDRPAPTQNAPGQPPGLVRQYAR